MFLLLATAIYLLGVLFGPFDTLYVSPTVVAIASAIGCLGVSRNRWELRFNAGGTNRKLVQPVGYSAAQANELAKAMKSIARELGAQPVGTVVTGFTQSAI